MAETQNVNPIIPLTLLEAVRELDQFTIPSAEEYDNELTPVRLGRSPTVSAEIERYEGLLKRRRGVEPGEVVQLLRLVGRRSDAGVAFNQAGRSAGQRALRRLPTSLRLAHRVVPFVRNRIGLASAERIVSQVFGGTMSADGVREVVITANPPSAVATPGGAACGFYAAALAEVLRTLTDFDGAMVHDSCMARGDTTCRWHTNPAAS